ncbi:CatB-related O-acetyltransferase [Sphingobacterium rhinopitheci]|uniref:CatB-related O-acetyltransferase n=1 Tax=Sphingobacterium rhinopitheci TaxID=2781960 RepID=UPI00293E3948|nr:CatB-related O-acetyltransferase [Sphingobacterium rhinopitheci]MCI0922716.1 CatB-related O-acetyltransferase [Sphingobacterium rhinopitheci]
MKVNNLAFILYKKIPNNRFRNLLVKYLLSVEGFGYSVTVQYIFKEIHGISIGYGSVKSGCINRFNIQGKVNFGNYCSIAKSAKFFTVNHPIDLFTSHAITYNPLLGGVLKDKLDRSKILIIEDDVWIGDNAIILPGVNRIGRGAIVGAGSVVTKDVPPYSIVAGNPCKFIRMRFNRDKISLLETSRWWELDKVDLMLKIDELNSMMLR